MAQRRCRQGSAGAQGVREIEIHRSLFSTSIFDTHRTPVEFLNAIKGKKVLVRLNSGVDYRGILACLDGYMNIAMEQTEVRKGCMFCDRHAPCAMRGMLPTPGICERAAEEQVRGCIHPRKQWWVLDSG